MHGKVKEGDVIADGAATRDEELALGKNVLVAFMPWRGYNFEDAILVSEKLLKEGTYTSVHIEEFEIDARDTRLGNEEITRDIPNVGEDALRNLDTGGIVRVGAEIMPGDMVLDNNGGVYNVIDADPNGITVSEEIYPNLLVADDDAKPTRLYYGRSSAAGQRGTLKKVARVLNVVRLLP